MACLTTNVSDDGAEPTSFALFDRQNRTDVSWREITPGKQTQNAFIEEFAGRLRDELLKESVFANLR